MPRSFLSRLLLNWLDSYDDVLNAALSLLYAQVAVGLLGTLHSQATGVVNADLAVAFFGLVAIASAYQSLGRTYAALLASMLLLDSLWLVCYSPLFWNTWSKGEGLWDWEAVTALLTLLASASGFGMRLLSVLLWAQMFRLGWAASEAYYSGFPAAPFLAGIPDADQISVSRRTPADGSPRVTRQASNSDEFLGSSIFYPPSFAALSQRRQLSEYLRDDTNSWSQASHDGSAHEGPAAIPEEPEDTEEEGKGAADPEQEQGQDIARVPQRHAVVLVSPSSKGSSSETVGSSDRHSREERGGMC